jgi:hypothetical protein
MNPRNSEQSRILRTVQVLTCIAVFGWGWLAIGAVRSWSFGFSVKALIAEAVLAACVVAPVAIAIPIVLQSWRRGLVVAVSIFAAALTAAEVHAAVQEAIVINRYGRQPEQAVFVERWPPFGSSSIFYEHGIGWSAHD